MPPITKSSESRVRKILVFPFSPSRSIERITPKTGFIKPKTEILETGLNFSSNPHIEKAAAETKARYNSIPQPLRSADGIWPPKIILTAIIKAPPKTNCQPLSITVSSVFENFFVREAENA